MFAATPSWLPFVLGLSGAAIPVTVGAFAVRRKTSAETTDIITQAATRAVDLLQGRINDLQLEIKTLRDHQVADQAERAALNMRLAQSEARERSALVRIGEMQSEIDALRARVQRHENPPTTPPSGGS